MTERKKKTVHPPLKRKRQYRPKEFADMENILNMRMNPARNGKTLKSKRTYQAETLGLPPLKMVLVHAANDRANEAAKSRKKKELTQEEAVIKIIEHLTKSQ